MSIIKWWFNLNWSHLLWRRVKLSQKEASAYYLSEEFLPQAVRPFCRQSWTSFISCVIQLFFKRKSQSTRDPQCKHWSSPTFSKKIHHMIIIDHEEVLWTIFLHLLNQLLYWKYLLKSKVKNIYFITFFIMT